jgi:flagellar basal body P-ring protein FlgI
VADLPEDAAVRAYLEGPPAAGDTCDRCAMRAAAAVHLAGGRLLLCGHHGRQNQAVLQAQGALIVGELSFRPGPVAPARAAG